MRRVRVPLSDAELADISGVGHSRRPTTVKRPLSSPSAENVRGIADIAVERTSGVAVPKRFNATNRPSLLQTIMATLDRDTASVESGSRIMWGRLPSREST